MRGFFLTIPKDLEESAQIDGCSRTKAFARIALPLVAPGVAAAAIFAFVLSWNEFIVALTLTTKLRTVPVALWYFVGEHGMVNWGQLGAAAMVVSIPMVTMFILFQKYFIIGLTRGSVKY
jgi:ABC-type glycerol-3-phosphate transport system permease component